jgi:two-component system sensor histidine kinase/response regulator
MDGYVSKPINAEDLKDAISLAMPVRDESDRSESADEKPVERPPESPACWSRSKTLEGLGGDENLLRDVIEIFREEAPKHLASLRAAIAQLDAGVVEATAHSMKGGTWLPQCSGNSPNGPRTRGGRAELRSGGCRKISSAI